MKKVLEGFEGCFSKLPDPCIARKKLYPLNEVLFVVLCGSESGRDFVLFGNEKLDFLKTHFAFSNGIASKNAFTRVFAVLDPVIPGMIYGMGEGTSDGAGRGTGWVIAHM